ncbi:hypothetical protein D3C73_1276120 [compost metagenome]
MSFTVKSRLIENIEGTCLVDFICSRHFHHVVSGDLEGNCIALKQGRLSGRSRNQHIVSENKQTAILHNNHILIGNIGIAHLICGRIGHALASGLLEIQPADSDFNAARGRHIIGYRVTAEISAKYKILLVLDNPDHFLLQ